MAKRTTIKLSSPVIGHGAPVSSVVLREPTFAEHSVHGDPTIFARNSEGGVYLIENTAVIKAYLEACLVEPKDPLLLNQLSLADSIQLKDAMLDFFSDARETLKAAALSTS